MCKILAEKIIDLHSKEKISRNHLCLYKGVFSVKRLPFAQICVWAARRGRSYGGIRNNTKSIKMTFLFASVIFFV